VIAVDSGSATHTVSEPVVASLLPLSRRLDTAREFIVTRWAQQKQVEAEWVGNENKKVAMF